MELLELQILMGWWSGFEPRSTPVQSKKITGSYLRLFNLFLYKAFNLIVSILITYICRSVLVLLYKTTT